MWYYTIRIYIYIYEITSTLSHAILAWCTWDYERPLTVIQPCNLIQCSLITWVSCIPLCDRKHILSLSHSLYIHTSLPFSLLNIHIIIQLCNFETDNNNPLWPNSIQTKLTLINQDKNQGNDKIQKKYYTSNFTPVDFVFFFFYLNSMHSDLFIFLISDNFHFPHSSQIFFCSRLSSHVFPFL